MLKPWNQNEKLKLIKLAADGLSTTQIGRLLGRSRNSVIGYAHRQGIDLKYVKKDLTKSEAAQKRRENVAKRTAASERQGPINWNMIKPKKNPKPPTFMQDRPAPNASTNVTFMQLAGYHCRAVIGNPNGIDTVYCGETAIFGKAWCTHHHKLYYHPAVDRSKVNVNKENNTGSRINF